MAKVIFDIGGQRGALDDFQGSDPLVLWALKEEHRRIHKALDGVSCPEHRAHPTVIVKGFTVDSLSYEYEVCCDTLLDIVEKKLE